MSFDADAAMRGALVVCALLSALATAACSAPPVAEAPSEPVADLRKPGVHVCNFSLRDVRLARAQAIRDAAEAEPALAVQGWFGLPAGRCLTLFEGPLPDRRVWVYAESLDGRVEWAGTTPACVGRGAFATRDPGCDFGAPRRKFRAIALRGPAEGPYTHMLR